MNKKHRNRTLVEVDNYSFDYEENKDDPLFKNLTFSIKEKETILLMGPSGAGKSTLALCLNGLYPEAVEGWAEGDICFKGKSIKNFKPGELNKRIGVVFQDPESQFCMITVENELAFTMENLSIPTEEMDDRMELVLQAVGMTSERKRNIHELSGGQKQKVALASVLLLNPSLLILDEPTANLDPASRYEFIGLIEKLKREWGMSVLIIEHQLDDWIAQTDRVLAMNSRGEVFIDSPPREAFYGRCTELEQEGIHLPKVVKTAVNMGVEAFQKEPLTEEELGLLLMDNPGVQGESGEIKAGVKQKFNGSIIALNDLYFHRKKKVPILSGVNLEVNKGEFIGIVGENGAGKSTLLQIMAGILTPQKGERRFIDRDYEKWGQRDLRRELGFVFQNPEHQFIADTVYDEISFGMKLNEKDEGVILDQTEELMRKFHLEKKKWANPFSLSGGQKRRLSVATMLDETPGVLLFDEPTFGQDAKTTKELMKMVTDLRDQGTAIVFVTHDMDLVDRYCDRVYVLNEGKIDFDGSPAELWNNRQLIREAKLRLPYRVRIQDRKEVKEEVAGHA
ncbi:ABC transporter ATP-binding protein [Bacillus sp. H-16]|uniref:energy-coupling factor transporter ATPase n=1 Tax=Alteribacter salitolerans TaxID=2912333 RepID=UPI001966BF92|nr:ABC transporter ATP-binding protein [Alteribacter salitolerans]